MAVRFAELKVFDTDLLSECIRQKEEALAFLEQTPIEHRRTTVVNEIELIAPRYQQIQTADTVERIVSAQMRLDQTKLFLASFPVVFPMDEEAGRLYFNLARQRGLRKIGRRDLMIAAIALRNAATLVTGNTQHFARIPGLALRAWRER